MSSRCFQRDMRGNRLENTGSCPGEKCWSDLTLLLPYLRGYLVPTRPRRAQKPSLPRHQPHRPSVLAPCLPLCTLQPDAGIPPSPGPPFPSSEPVHGLLTLFWMVFPRVPPGAPIPDVPTSKPWQRPPQARVLTATSVGCKGSLSPSPSEILGGVAWELSVCACEPGRLGPEPLSPVGTVQPAALCFSVLICKMGMTWTLHLGERTAWIRERWHAVRASQC